MRKTILPWIMLIAIGTIQDVKGQSVHTADSLFFAKNWMEAITAYEKEQQITAASALSLNRLGFSYHNHGDLTKAKENYLKALEKSPSPPLEIVIQTRLARVYSLLGQIDPSFECLNNALKLGYAAVTELKNQADFNNDRNDARYKTVVETAFENAFPCMKDPKARQFDFWVGEWTVLDTDTKVQVGKSKIEIASGGCVILENFEGVADTPFAGKSMNFVNTGTGKWEQLWAGPEGLSDNNPRKFVDGEYLDNAMRFKFTPPSAKGKKSIGRFTFFNKGPAEVRQLKEISNNEGKSWDVVYDFTYKRNSASE